MIDFKNRKAPDIPAQRNKELLLFQKANGLKFKDVGLLNNAFIHSSYANESKKIKIKDNERLEFLGDSVLSVVVSQWLYCNLIVDEGECTRIRSFVVSEDALSKIAKKIEIDKYLLIGKGEEMSGGREKKAILADCMEAVFAAIYLDRGFASASEFILKLLVPEIEDVIRNKHRKDFKTMLQEYVQKTFKIVPEYSLVKATGPEHDQQFYYCVEFNGRKFGPEKGHNKKDAEQAVARKAWLELGFEDN